MPRNARRRTLSGAPGQAPAAPRGTTYGDGEAALESQRLMPVPDLASAPPASQAAQSSSTPAQGGGGGGPTLGPADRLQMAMQLMQRMSPDVPLGAPSERPNQPLTAGLAQGPGPGPEVLRPGDRATQALRLLADFSDDPALGDLADLAQRMGR